MSYGLLASVATWGVHFMVIIFTIHHAIFLPKIVAIQWPCALVANKVLLMICIAHGQGHFLE